jgi:hypothetical protein
MAAAKSVIRFWSGKRLRNAPWQYNQAGGGRVERKRGGGGAAAAKQREE